MSYKKIAIIGSIISFVSFVMSLVTMIVTKNVNAYDIVYLILVFIGGAMMLYGLRIRWHIGAGALVVAIGLIINSVYYGATNVATGSDYSIVAGILDFIFVFLLFDTVIMIIHTMLNIKLVKPFASLIVMVTGIVGIGLAVYLFLLGLFQENPNYLNISLSSVSLLVASTVIVFSSLFLKKIIKGE